ncbi:Transcriptional regulator KdgR [Vibrio aerogenes CECT 7868]|uniref:Transcriptional regulator KdgR n=1 Tax=Vibrio aerogenes CECT 7868 TaxID=1216006 RepID=A0A1M5ZI23_9VIBR|nr:IclR family transcriptional regulator [Vibrio aerogenes]SHI23573.1 Transcriptional regulator KdgR [Vibrio aerogenes CECT 7868]
MTKKPEYRAPALEKGLEILELLAKAEVPLTKKQIAEKLNRSVSEIFRMLSVLKEKRYIECHKETAGYVLTLKMFALSNQHPPVMLLLRRCALLTEKLCKKVNQSCHISRYSNGELLVIAREENPYKMGFSLKVGARIDVFASGSGAVLLGFCAPEIREAILTNEYATASLIETTLQQAEETRQRGYFLGKSPQISGVTNISAPIFGPQGDLLAVITIPYMTLNSETVCHSVKGIEQAKDELIRVAGELSQNPISPSL